MVFQKPAFLKYVFCLGLLVIARHGYGQDENERIQDKDRADHRLLNQVFDPVNFNPNEIKVYMGVPSFFERENTRGSQYLSKHWLYGMISTTNRPADVKPELSYFNFDKINSRVIYTDGKKIVPLSSDSISSFAFSDSGTIYYFEKLRLIDRHLFLQPVIKNEQGYSLYKRLFTKFYPADYQPFGYGSSGKRYGEFVDYYEYYIVYPGGTKYKKLILNRNSIRRDLKDQQDAVKELFNYSDRPITEEMLINLVLFINGKTRL
jgi:hypothetical protein